MATLQKLIESEIADFFAGFGSPGEPESPAEMQSQLLARVAPLLASKEREPVYQVRHGDQWRDLNKAQYDDHVNLGADGLRIVYAAPQLPQPAVAITQHFDTIALDTAKMVMCDVNRRDEFLGGDIQLLSRIQCRIDEACRAAMLRGAEPVRQPLAFFDGDISPEDAEKIIARLREMNSRPGSQQVMIAEPASQPNTLRDGWVAVPVDMAPEMMRAVQINSELGAYAAANLTGAYSLFREFWDVAIAATPDFREIANSSTINFRENAETSTKCWCHTCRPVTMSDMRFVVCPECGNKRCPRANDHRNACTGSNEPGQEGSAYPAAPQQEVK